jgi:hypothetical protein
MADWIYPVVRVAGFPEASAPPLPPSGGPIRQTGDGLNRPLCDISPNVVAGSGTLLVIVKFTPLYDKGPGVAAGAGVQKI